MAALNPGQFKGPLYHGTTWDLQGKDIVPAQTSGNSQWATHGHHGQRSNEHAFATESEDTAWDFASQGGMIARSRASLQGAQPPGRVRVHEVAPHPLMQMGVYHRQHPDFDEDGVGTDLKEWRSPAFRSKGTIDTMPGRQGTFPQLNWNQFARKDAHYKNDFNHPTDENIAEGHKNPAPTGTQSILATLDSLPPAKPKSDPRQQTLF